MADGTIKEQEIEATEVIKGKEGLLEALRQFKWINPEKNELGEYKSNWEIIDESIGALEKDEFFGQDGTQSHQQAEELKRWIRDIREKANTIYKEIYPQGLEKKETVIEVPYYHGIEPFYHGVGEEKDWLGHNDYVMAVAARIFSGLLKIQKRAGSGEEDWRKQWDEFFGPDWQAKELTLVDFKTLMAMAAFHEVGEWWIKSFWEEGLARQRKQFNKQLNAGLSIEDFVIDPTLRKIVWELKEKIREKGIRNTNFVIDKVREAIGEFGIRIRYDGEDKKGEASEFYLDFEGGRPEDLAFDPKEVPKSTGEKPFILARIFKAADFSQAVSPEYLKEVHYLPWGEETPERKRLRKGPLVLWPEFYGFKPGALKVLEAARPEDVEMSQRFYGILKENFAKEAVLQIFDQCFASPAKNPYRQGAEIVGKPFGDNSSS